MPVGVSLALFGNLNFPVALQYFGVLLIGESLARLNLEAKHVGKASGVSYSGTLLEISVPCFVHLCLSL